jgi:hypothetical protein
VGTTLRFQLKAQLFRGKSLQEQREDLTALAYDVHGLKGMGLEVLRELQLSHA